MSKTSQRKQTAYQLGYDHGYKGCETKSTKFKSNDPAITRWYKLGRTLGNKAAKLKRETPVIEGIDPF